MESRPVVVTGYCVMQISTGLLFVPFGVTEYRCNSSRGWSARPARSLILCPRFSQPSSRCQVYSLSRCVCVICTLVQRTAPNLSAESLKGTILMCSRLWIGVLKQRFLPSVGLSDMCDSVYRRFGSWDSGSGAFLEEEMPSCLSWALKLGGTNVNLDQENLLTTDCLH